MPLLRRLGVLCTMHVRPAGAAYQPPCRCSTSRAGLALAGASAARQPQRVQHGQATATPVREPELAPLVIDTGEYRCGRARRGLIGSRGRTQGTARALLRIAWKDPVVCASAEGWRVRRRNVGICLVNSDGLVWAGR